MNCNLAFLLALTKTFTIKVVPFQRKPNKGQLPQYFISGNHEPIITREQLEVFKEIYEYRRKQMGIDDSGKYQSPYTSIKLTLNYSLNRKIDISKLTCIDIKKKFAIQTVLTEKEAEILNNGGIFIERDGEILMVKNINKIRIHSVPHDKGWLPNDNK